MSDESFIGLVLCSQIKFYFDGVESKRWPIFIDENLLGNEKDGRVEEYITLFLNE